jgi:hypothetical protein
MLLAALLIGGLATGLAGCNDKGEQEMMQQMLSSNNGTPAKPADRAAAAETPGMATGTEAEEQAEETEAPELVENVIIEDVEVKAPYPEFDGEGRYDVKVTCLLKQYEDAQVYQIVALDDEGNEVGSQDKHLKLPIKKARTFDFNEFYCTHMPTTIAFYRTDKEAVAANEGEEGGGKNVGRGTAGSGSDNGDRPVQGRGVAGGG